MGDRPIIRDTKDLKLVKRTELPERASRPARGDRPTKSARPARGKFGTRSSAERPTKSRSFLHRGTRDSESRERKPFGGRNGKTFSKSSSEKPVLSLKRPKKITGPIPAPETSSETKSGTIRLNKFISNAGITSRRKADELITGGAVSVNGKKVTELGVQVKPYEDLITVNGETISLKPRYLYLLLNKPKDTITTTSDEKDRTTVLDYVQTEERVYPVGRLDRNTTGVLLLTNDGELTNRLTHPSFEIEREYHVTLDKPLVKADAKKISEGGIDIGDGDITGPAELSLLDSSEEVLLKIKEGKNREVRRIFESMGYEVEKLDRIMFAGLTHRGMSRGESRQLTSPEIHRLKDLAGINSEV